MTVPAAHHPEISVCSVSYPLFPFLCKQSLEWVINSAAHRYDAYQHPKTQPVGSGTIMLWGGEGAKSNSTEQADLFSNIKFML